MPPEAGYAITLVIMTTLSIPIIALLKWRPRNRDYEARIETLEKRIQELEGKSATANLEIETIKRDVAFTGRLLQK